MSMDIDKTIKLAVEYYQVGNMQQAETLLKEILELQPNNIKAIKLIGIIYYQLKNYDSAIQYMKILINENPNDAYAYFIHGHSMQEKGQLNEAINYYQNCLQLNSNFADAYYNLGTIFQDKGRDDEAIQCYQKVLQINPNDPDAYYNLGCALQEKGQLDEAMTYYQKALQINPNEIIKRLGFEVKDGYNVSLFHSNHYQMHNERRLEHLASLQIPVVGMTVVDIGAGIGDHSQYYIDRGCRVTITEVRTENLLYLRKKYPNQDVQYIDLERLTPIKNSPFDIVHCYGVLYHVSNPEKVLKFLNSCCRRILFLETCVSFGDKKEINPVKENKLSPTQSFSGIGCRPTRIWLFEKLKELFQYVYIPITQPNHEEFPLDWTDPHKHQNALCRSVFIASHYELNNEILTQSLIHQQIRYE